LASYGLKAEDLIEAGKMFNRSHPRHVSLFRNARSHFQTDRYFFTHAGIDPSAPLQEQYDHDMMWIRDDFLGYLGTFEKIVVHGHTITKSELPEIHQNRIALDTGSYRTGRIAAAIFVDDQVSGFIVSEATKHGDKIMRFDENMIAI
jgi:serine/threonine protein phosphatase 1